MGTNSGSCLDYFSSLSFRPDLRSKVARGELARRDLEQHGLLSSADLLRIVATGREPATLNDPLFRIGEPLDRLFVRHLRLLWSRGEESHGVRIGRCFDDLGVAPHLHHRPPIQHDDSASPRALAKVPRYRKIVRHEDESRV